MEIPPPFCLVFPNEALALGTHQGKAKSRVLIKGPTERLVEAPWTLVWEAPVLFLEAVRSWVNHLPPTILSPSLCERTKITAHPSLLLSSEKQ